MLQRIGLKNFKCFEQLDLPCAPLNLLCGLNGMGKSSVIQALLVLRQSFETGGLLEGHLVLGSELTDLGAGSDVLFEDADDQVVGFVLREDAKEPWAWAFWCPGDGDGLFAVERDDVVRFLSAEDAPLAWRKVQPPGEGAPTVASPDKLRDGTIPEPRKGRVPFPRAYVPAAWRETPPFGGRVVYVQAERVGPRKLYPLSEVKARRGDLGSDGQYAWNYLNDHQDIVLEADDPRCGDAPGRRLLDVVDHWLQDVSPGAHLQLETELAADSVIAGFTFDRHGNAATRRYRATNVGFGLSYVFPVVQALLSPPGTLCLIENPEAHLHPRGQTKLAELAVRAAKAGVQVFVETHSDHFLDGVRIAVRDDLIDAAETKIHYFERNDVGRTVVTSPELDADGRLSHWPVGFFDQHEGNLVRLLAPKR